MKFLYLENKRSNINYFQDNAFSTVFASNTSTNRETYTSEFLDKALQKEPYCFRTPMASKLDLLITIRKAWTELYDYHDAHSYSIVVMCSLHMRGVARCSNPGKFR